MADTWYLVAALLIVFAITFCLRALPFAALKPLRRSRFAKAMATWMPAGILVILALATLRSSAGAGSGHLWQALVAAAVTVAVHLLGRRRTLVSVGAGTVVFVALVAIF